MDVLNKVIGIIIIAIMLLVAPLALNNISDRAAQKLECLNEMQNFLDKVTDKGYITTTDLNELYLNMAATGMSLDIDIEHFRLLADGDRVVLCKECSIDERRIDREGGKYEIEITDVVKISVNEVANSRSSILWRRIFGSDDLFNEALSAMRR